MLSASVITTVKCSSFQYARHIWHSKQNTLGKYGEEIKLKSNLLDALIFGNATQAHAVRATRACQSHVV